MAACGGSSSPAKSAKAADTNKKITLKINFWGDFGFKQLAPEYKKLHPNVTLVLNAGDYNQQHQDLQKFLVAGSGAPDIAAIDEGFIVQFRNQADKFVNLVQDLRETESSLFTQRDTPMHVGVQMPLADILKSF